MKPLAIDLFCGLGGWTEGLLAEGYYVVGFDIEQHVYGEHRYPAQLVIQDVLTLHGSQFKDAALIVASPPCQAYSYRAMPWKRAKALPPPDNSLFEACFRIQREASEAAGQHVPMVVENVRGAIPWVGRSRWNFGSFHLWGDVPALMPMTKQVAKRPWHDWNRFKQTGEVSPHWRLNGEDSLEVNPAIKNAGGSWFAVSHNKVPHSRGDAIKGNGGSCFGGNKDSPGRRTRSKSKARKAAAAAIAKIPFPLSSHIARTYFPAAKDSQHG